MCLWVKNSFSVKKLSNSISSQRISTVSVDTGIALQNGDISYFQISLRPPGSELRSRIPRQIHNASKFEFGTSSLNLSHMLNLLVVLINRVFLNFVSSFRQIFRITAAV